MPVYLDRADRFTRASLRLGLVNNMPSSAATEHQFVSLLERASGGMDVSISFYTLPDFAAEAAGACEAASIRRYQSTDVLYTLPPGAAPDALLVTGREPLTADLRDEPYWGSFVSLLEWARGNTLSTIWSCLAAHAAVLHLDGIRRHRSMKKHCGLFLCYQPSPRRAAFPISAPPSHWYVPHSRWNALAEPDLRAAGYSLLTLTTNGEVDAFLRPNTAREESVFLFFQGHPEYETDTLMREYRRDVGRCLTGASQAYPSLPVRYFDDATEDSLCALRDRAAAGETDGLQTALSAVLATAHIENSWAEPAAFLHRQWLQFLLGEKARRCAKRMPVGLFTSAEPCRGIAAL